MPKRSKSYESDLQERLRDPEYAIQFLKATLEDEDEHSDAVFLMALREVALANGVSAIADSTGLNRENIYRMLSGAGNPAFGSIKAILNAVGLRLSVEPLNGTRMDKQSFAMPEIDFSPFDLPVKPMYGVRLTSVSLLSFDNAQGKLSSLQASLPYPKQFIAEAQGPTSFAYGA